MVQVKKILGKGVVKMNLYMIDTNILAVFCFLLVPIVLLHLICGVLVGPKKTQRNGVVKMNF